MAVEDFYTVEKPIVFRSFKNLTQIGRALKGIPKIHDPKVQVSILGKFPELYSEDMKSWETINLKMRVYLKKLLGADIQYGGFDNPEIGFVFVAGPLTSIFLNKINGKSLGNMSTGIYGILRGLGADTYQAKNYLKTLSNNEFLLIIRGFESNLY